MSGLNRYGIVFWMALATMTPARDDIGERCLFGIAYILAVPGQNGFNPALLLRKNWNNGSENI